jgi:hypothetical protein
VLAIGYRYLPFANFAAMPLVLLSPSGSRGIVRQRHTVPPRHSWRISFLGLAPLPRFSPERDTPARQRTGDLAE